MSKAPCGLCGCKNWPAPFPGRMSYKATKSIVYILAGYIVLLVFIAMCSDFWLFWLSYQYLPRDWLARLLWGSLIVARGSSPERPGAWFSWFIVLLNCFIMYLCCFLPLRDILSYTVMTRYSLFVLKVPPLNPKQTNKQTIWYLKEWTHRHFLTIWYGHHSSFYGPYRCYEIPTARALNARGCRNLAIITLYLRHGTT